MKKIYRARQIIAIFTLVAAASSVIYTSPDFNQNAKPQTLESSNSMSNSKNMLDGIEVKGRAPKTGYSRDNFGKGWQKHSDGCDTRNKILKRDLINTTENDRCQVLSGELNDPYTGEIIKFSRKENASKVQIDHIVALSDSWQKGAQQLTFEKRKELANDPLNLIASEGSANQQKSDSDAATWLPPNKQFRCQYIERQISVKKKYSIWVTPAEKAAMTNVLQNCS